MDGKVRTFKARLIAKGYTQTYGVDYGETLSPVTDIRAIRILLAITALYDYAICRSNVAFLILYVDDILLMGNNVTMLQEVKSWLYKCYSMKDLGEATYILRINIIQDRSKRLIALSQSTYLEKSLKKFRMENSKKGYTSMIEKPDYRMSQGAKTPSEVQRMRRVPYALAIGSCMRNTKDMVFVYGAKPEAELKVSCYADASKSAKQSTTAMSSTEVEYIVAAEASMEAV
ncbi:putative reverse transcriptase domain-containing protein [Tanacetum coccineum]